MLGSAFVFLGRSYLINEYRDKMDNNAEEVAHAASALSIGNGISGWDLRMVISSLASSTGNHIFITSADGLVLLCSDKQLNSPLIGKQLSDNVMSLLTTSGSIDQLTNLDGFYNGTRFVVAKPIHNIDDALIGYVFVSSDTSSIVGAYRTFLWVSLAVAAAVMMIALLISLAYSKRRLNRWTKWPLPPDDLRTVTFPFGSKTTSCAQTRWGRSLILSMKWRTRLKNPRPGATLSSATFPTSCAPL